MEYLRCYAKISIKNLLHNFDCIKELLNDGCEIIPIIKANAYSHGAIEIAHALSSRVSTFAVAELNEALALRDEGINNSILVLGYTDPSFAPLLAEKNIIQTVTGFEYARKLSENTDLTPLYVHIKLDTGMRRFGLDADNPDTIEEIEKISKLNNIAIKGIFSHFAESDDMSSDFTSIQFKKFTDTVATLKTRGVETGISHIANSAAILARPKTHLSAVRPGIALYGAYPSEDIKNAYLSKHPDKPLKEVMTLCARVGQLHEVKKGDGIGYSRTHTFEKDSRIAVVSAGYADGIPRALSNKGRVKINGEFFNIVGNVCMDLLMVDITDAKVNIAQGDEVTFWGSEGITIDEYAALSNRINYELYTGMSPRVARKYVE